MSLPCCTQLPTPQEISQSSTQKISQVTSQENLSAVGAASHGSQVQISNCNVFDSSVTSMKSDVIIAPSINSDANYVSESLPSQLPMTYWDHLVAVKDASFI